MNELTTTPKTPVWFKAILLLGMLLFAFYASTHMVAAGDTWVAMACGRHFANHGVDTVEPFSFNSHKAGPSDETLSKLGFPEWTQGVVRKMHPTGWINQNWLTHLIFYKLATWFGKDGAYNFDTLVYWKFAIYFVTVLLVYSIGKVLGAGDTLSAAAACLAMLVGRSFYDIRPAGYSNMLVPAFMLVLALTMCKNYRLIWLLIPLIVFWANVHGGYIYAFIMLAPFIGINLLLRLPKRWSLCLGFMGLWAVLYLMSHKFITHEYYLNVQKVVIGHEPEPVSLLSNKMFGILVFLCVVSLVLAVVKKVPSGLFYAYHFAASGIYFISLLIRFLPAHPKNLTDYYETIYSHFVSSSQLSFIFVFIAVGLLISAMAFKKEAFVYLSTRGLWHTIAASGVALIAMIIFNPFHLTNLTHTFEISVSKHAESWRQVNEWKPAFDFMDKTTTVPNPVGQEEWFGVLCILTLVVFIVWLMSYFLKPRTGKNISKRVDPQTDKTGGTYSWPKINLALIVISFLTIYMAIRSRRFIAIAGAAACPIIAVLVYQAWQMLSAKIMHYKTGRVETWSIPNLGVKIIYGILTILVINQCVFWGREYKRIYLDPWPSDSIYNSVFMRMTASHLKPMEACEFIRLNKLSGRIFNYWTEGGAVALGQDPDPETGKIPLKLFMDGRAQAAYNHDKFKLWQTIFSGGPVAQQAQIQGKKLSQADYHAIGEWLDTELRKRNVWVTLMPMSQENSTYMTALRATSSWKTGYIDDVQHMLINTQTSEGQALINNILEGKALFPNDYVKDITTFYVITENKRVDRYPDLYALVKDAFEKRFSPTAVQLMKSSWQNKLPGSQTIISEFERFLNDFVDNQDRYKSSDGYQAHLTTGIYCADFLANRESEKQRYYTGLSQQFRKEAEAIKDRQIW